MAIWKSFAKLNCVLVVCFSLFECLVTHVSILLVEIRLYLDGNFGTQLTYSNVKVHQFSKVKINRFAVRRNTKTVEYKQKHNENTKTY